MMFRFEEGQVMAWKTNEDGSRTYTSSGLRVECSNTNWWVGFDMDGLVARMGERAASVEDAEVAARYWLAKLHRKAKRASKS